MEETALVRRENFKVDYIYFPDHCSSHIMECSHVQPNETLLYQYKQFIQRGESTVSRLGDQEISHVDEEEELVEIGTESSTIHQGTTGEKTPSKLQDKKNPAEDITNDFVPKYQKDEVEKLLELADDDEGVSFTYPGKLKETQNDEVFEERLYKETQQTEPLQELEKTELSSSFNKREETSHRENQSEKVEEKPVPAPRRFFLSDKKTEVAELKSRTFSHVTSYYHQGLHPAIGKIS